MDVSKRVKGRLAVLGGAVLVMALLVAGVTVGAVRPALADVHPGVNFTMSVPGYGGCTTSQGDAQCYIPPGTTFTVNVALDPLPSDVPTYQGYDVKISYTGLTSADNASTAMWPDCTYPAAFYEPGLVNMACTIGVDSAPSSYTGLVGTNDFTCSQSGNLSLLHGDGQTDLIVDIGVTNWEAGEAEVLNITCGSPPTATTPPTATPLPGLVPSGNAGSSQGGSDGSLLLIIGSLMGLAAASLVVLTRSARSR